MAEINPWPSNFESEWTTAAMVREMFKKRMMEAQNTQMRTPITHSRCWPSSLVYSIGKTLRQTGGKLWYQKCVGFVAIFFQRMAGPVVD